MNKDIHIAKIGARAIIIAAIIGGLFTIISAFIENDKLRSNYEQLQIGNNELTAYKKIIEEKNSDLQNEYNNLEKKYLSLKDEFDNLNEDYLLSKNSDSNNENELINETDQEEIDNIIKRINEFREWNDSKKYDEFTFFEIDLYEIELMYKLFLSEEYYKYENVILAFEQYGINCEELSINKYILELWDIQILCTYYNIYNNIEKTETKSYPFDMYKMKEIDTFDYRGHCMIYHNDTYEFIYTDMKKRINKVIRKMNRNNLPLARYN